MSANRESVDNLFCSDYQRGLATDIEADTGARRTGEEVDSSLNDIVDIFELLGEWDQRYQYLTELGENLEFMPNELKTENNRVKACMSKVWVSAYPDACDAHRVRFHGDCDTSIIKGVLAVLIQLTAGKTVQQIEQLDVDELFSRLHLDEHLSPNRHVGVYAIVDLMKRQAGRLRCLASVQGAGPVSKRPISNKE